MSKKNFFRHKRLENVLEGYSFVVLNRNIKLFYQMYRIFSFWVFEFLILTKFVKKVNYFVVKIPNIFNFVVKKIIKYISFFFIYVRILNVHKKLKTRKIVKYFVVKDAYNVQKKWTKG